MLKKTFVHFLTCIFFLSCKDNSEDLPNKVITSNVELNNFIQVDSSNYFVLAQNKIRLLNLNQPSSLTISSTLPFTEISFETVQGNTDTLYIQTKNSIDIYVLSKGNSINWEKKSSIAAVLPCDKFLVKSKKLFISKGGSDCNRNAINSELIVYKLKDLSNPTILSRIETKNPLELKQNRTSIFLLLTDNSINKVVFLTDSTFEVKNLKVVLNAKEIDVFSDKIIVKAPKLISQFAIKENDNLELLSTIPTTE